MKLDGLVRHKPCVFALEVFPPKRGASLDALYLTLEQMTETEPDYISVTYSAGGSGDTEYTAQIAAYIKNNLGIEPLAHLTCGNSGRQDIYRELEVLRGAGIENVLALRGDRVPGVQGNGDFAHASDLMHAIREYGGFATAGACYPEGHPESENVAADVESLRTKVEAGATHLVSQLFFDNGKFFRFLNLARKKRVDVPIEAGVMPIVRPEQIERTVSLSSASLPSGFTKMVSRYSHDKTAFYDAGIDYAIRQIRDLLENGVDGIHLYAMNNPDVATKIRQGIDDLLYSAVRGDRKWSLTQPCPRI